MEETFRKSPLLTQFVRKHLRIHLFFAHHIHKKCDLVVADLYDYHCLKMEVVSRGVVTSFCLDNTLWMIPYDNTLWLVIFMCLNFCGFHEVFLSMKNY